MGTISIGDTVSGGTAGSVLFVGAGPLLAQDNNDFFWDSATNTLKSKDQTTAASSSFKLSSGNVTTGNGSSNSGGVTVDTGFGQPNTSGSGSAGNSGNLTLNSGQGGSGGGGSLSGASGNVLLKTGSGGGNAQTGHSGGSAGHIILQPGNGGSGPAGQGAGGSTLVRASNSGDIFAVQNSAGSTTHLGVANSGNVRVGASSATARLHLGAGTSSLAPLKFTAGTNLSSAAAGAMEFDGTNLYITQSDGTRKTLQFSDQVANVLDFGAIGNDIADDTAGIQAAVDSVTPTGGVVWFPSNKTYRVSGSIDINSYFPIFLTSRMKFVPGMYNTFFPESLKKAIIKPTAAISDAIFHWSLPSGETDEAKNGGGGMIGLTISDIIGNCAVRNYAIDSAVWVEYATLFIIRECIFSNIKGGAIRLGYTSTTRVIDVLIQGCGNVLGNGTPQPAIEVGNGSDFAGLYLHNSTIENNFSTAYIKVATGGNPVANIWNCYFEATAAVTDTNQFYIDGGRAHIWNSFFERNTNSGGLVRTTSADNFILNSEVNANGVAGPLITMSGVRSAVIGCNLYHGSIGGSVVLSGASSRCIGNLFSGTGTGGGGVNTSGGTGTSIITNNVFEGLSGTPITSAAGDVVDNNVGFGSGSILWDPGNLIDGAGETSAAIAVTGAAFGDFVDVAAPYDLQGITCNGYVSSAGNVKIRLQNETGGAINLLSGTWKVRVRKG